MASEVKKKQAKEASGNTELIFSRVLYLAANGSIDFSTLFNYELAPVPTSLFKDTSEARYPSAKSTLMQKLKSKTRTRGLSTETVAIDGGGLLHNIY